MTQPSLPAPGDVLSGTPVVPGAAFGPVVLAGRTEVARGVVAAYEEESPSPAAVLAAFDGAVATVSGRLFARAASVRGSAAEVLTATAGLTRDPALRAAVVGRVESGERLLAALRGSIDEFAEVFGSVGGVLAERVSDLRDLERRLVAEIVGEPEPRLPTPATPSVLVTEDLAPADAAGLDPALVIALVTEEGGPTSHTAVIARQLGIPCVMAVRGVMQLVGGTAVLVDANTGVVEIEPDPAAARRRVAAAEATRVAVAAWTGPAHTADGTRVRLLANVADRASAVQAADGPVEGSGLFRTELCFLNRRVEPSAEEQADHYAAVLSAFGADRTVVVRTLDAGSDKPVGFATLAGADNPALGVRGVRVSFGNPGLLDRQLDAIAQAAERTGTTPWVMAPMVATVDEATTFAEKVRGRGLVAGVMVEVPSTALLAHRFLQEVDFLSIGTNDLAQFTMAADRLAADLAHLTDPWQPAVLALVAIAAEAGRRAGKPVGVCGEAAADPLLATALVGMGVTSLSMAAAAVQAVGAQLAEVSMDTCEAAAEAALAARDPSAARAAVRALVGGQPQ